MINKYTLLSEIEGTHYTNRQNHLPHKGIYITIEYLYHL